MFDLTAFLSALASDKWPLAVALVIAALVALAKAKVAWIDTKVPATLVPYVAIVLAFAATASADTIAGQSVTAALLDAFKAAIGGFLIQLPAGFGLRKKVIIPSEAPTKPELVPSRPPKGTP